MWVENFNVSSSMDVHKPFRSLAGGNSPELTWTHHFEMSIFIYFTAIHGVSLICIDSFHTLSPYA